MNLKALVKTKTFWGGVAAICSGVGMILSDNAAEGVQMIVMGALAVFGREAIAKVEK